SRRGDSVRFALSGELDNESAAGLRALLEEEERGPILLDLKEVTLVSRDAVRVLARLETAGVRIVRCPEYVRSLMAAEQESRSERRGRGMRIKFISHIMTRGKRRLLARGAALPALILTPLLGFGAKKPPPPAATGDQVEYEFGRPVQPGEQTYDWYRKTHAEEAAKRYGVDPAKVGDGMDTWHWWCGVDNPEFWRKVTVLSTTKEYSALDARLDFFRMLATTPRAKRWEMIGLINDPDTVPAEKPDKYPPIPDRTKDGALTWGPEAFGD